MTNRQILSRLVEVIRPYSGKLLIAMAAMVCVAGFNAAQAYMVQPLLDEIFVNKDRALLNVLPLALVGIFLGKGIFYYVYFYLLEYVGQRIIKDLRAVSTPISNPFAELLPPIPTGRADLAHHLGRGPASGRRVPSLVRILRDFVTIIGLWGSSFIWTGALATVSFILLPVAFCPLSSWRKVRQSPLSTGDTAWSPGIPRNPSFRG